MAKIPLIMVAPNGARRIIADHPALPVTIKALARTAAECHEAGAGAVHVHVRDQNQQHVLDAELYQAAIEAINRETGGRMLVQITTEAVGRYLPQQQRDVVYAVRPAAVSVALKEMIPDSSQEKQAALFYRFTDEENIAVQHILYDAEELVTFARYVTRGIIPGDEHSLLFVLGRYVEGQKSEPSMLDPFLQALEDCEFADKSQWAVCAFGAGETAALNYALKKGGTVRVGFENNLWHEDGTLAANNAERVAVIANCARELDLL